METAVISYRVADFLKKYAPFNTVDEADLVALAANGKVRFYEPNEYVIWQGEPHKAQIFVIQQGTVSLWDEQREQAQLRDVRGAGDMLGLERYNGSRSALYSARTESDVVIYAFPEYDFDAFILKYPHASQYVAAEGRVAHDYQPVGSRPEFPKAFLLEAARKPPLTCIASETVATAVGRLLAIRSDAIVVLGPEQQALGVLTRDSFLKWLTTPGASPEAPVASLLAATPVALAPDATIPNGVLAMIDADASALVITADGTPAGRVQALITRRDLQPLFGEVPTDLVRLCRVAADIPALRALNQRVRAFLLAHLSGPVGVAWLSRFASLVDEVILTRVIDIVAPGTDICWCVCGAAGRRESLTMRAPRVLAVASDRSPVEEASAASLRVMNALVECGYMISGDPLFTPDFLTATAAEWKARYRGWLVDPVGRDAHKARRLFDVRHVHGPYARWREVEAVAMSAVTPAFVHLMANDCLDSLPPLTFFKDAVVDAFGDQADIFRLEYSALRPLVDVGRVFGLAARAAFGHSTLERFATARVMLPEHDEIFREAADTLQLVLWQQARVGISNGTAGTELPASSLSRNDRQVLKGGFRSILRLLDFTANREWLARL